MTDAQVKTLFRQMAKETHPDHGGNTDQFREVFKAKNDYDALVNLANRWGIKLDGVPQGDYEKALDAIVGALITHTFTHKNKEQSLVGVIVAIRKITKGYRKGAREFKIFDLNSGQIWCLKTYEDQPFTRVEAMADISQLETGQKRVNDIKKFEKMKKQVKQDSADQHFTRTGLVKNKNYYGQNIKVMIEYRGGKMVWEELTRTTPKSVYIRSYGYKNDERRINISSVREKRRFE